MNAPQDFSGAPAPANIEAEQALLGAIFLNNEAYFAVEGIVSARDFSEEIHAEIFKSCASQINAGRAVTPVTMKGLLDQFQFPDGMTGFAYVARLAAEATTVINAPDYAQAIKDESVRRSALEILAEARDAILNRSGNAAPAEVTADIAGALQDVAERGGPATSVSFGNIMQSVLDKAQRRARGEEVGNFPTGLSQLDERLGGWRRSWLYVFGARPGMGKAQPLHSKIKTETGWTTFGAVKVGDRLASVDGRESVVTGVFPQGVKETFRVTLSDGRSTLCCADHLWEVRYRDWDAPRVLTTEILVKMLKRVRYRNRLIIGRASGDFGDATPLPLSPWLVGAMLARGALTNGSPIFSSERIDVVEKLRGYLASIGVSLKQITQFQYRMVGRGNGHANPLTALLRDNDMMGRHTFERRIPPSYLLADRAQRIELMRGIMDCGGWIETQGSVLYASASEGLALDVQELARSLGYWARMSQRKAFVYRFGERDQKRDSFKVCITGRGIEEIVSIDDKRSRLSNREWFRTLTIQSIEPAEREECCCISVSHESSLYLTDDYVVTHNTALAISMMLRAARAGRGVACFALEVEDEQMGARAISALNSGDGSLAYFRVMNFPLAEDQLQAIENTRREYEHLPIEMDFTRNLTLSQIEIRARIMARKLRRKGATLDLLVLDHIGLIESEGKQRDTRANEVSIMSRRLRALGQRLDCAVILLSQLNREVETRDDKRPVSSDLRESGSLEQDADVIGMLYRPAHYDEKTLRLINSGIHIKGIPENFEAVAAERANDLEVIFTKVRAGRPGTDVLSCLIERNYISTGRG